jgi:RHS repeat-associated protein
MSKHVGLIVGLWLTLGAASIFASGSMREKPGRKTMPDAAGVVTGQTATLLPDGEILLLGGEGPRGPLTTASLQNPRTGAVQTLPNGLLHARAGHTATMLPNGTVLIFGGIGTSGKIEAVEELFDPASQTFHNLPSIGLTPRAYHTATVLTDGRVLFAGGVLDADSITSSIEAWDYRTISAASFADGLLVPRSRHTATLLADGTVLFWGGFSNGSSLNFGEVFDPVTQHTRLETTKPLPGAQPQLEASIPQDGTTNVPETTLIALRFSEPLNVTTLNNQTITVSEPSSLVNAAVIPAEGGMLAFVTPTSSLAAGTTYTVTINGAFDSTGAPLSPTSISFTTPNDSEHPSSPLSSISSGDGDLWTPSITNFEGSWRSEHGKSPLQNLPPLSAKPGVTALAGQALRLNGLGLEGVTLQIDDCKTITDETGRFLLTNLTVGHHILLIDGTTANTAHRAYGIFEAGVDIVAGKTTALNYTIWMTRLDTEHTVTIPSPTTSPTVISTPLLPGLELHLAPNTVIQDHNEKIVTQVNITPIPIDQPPFPLPVGVNVPIYFTIQPGDAYIETSSGSWAKGARLFYPNSHKAKPNTVFDFWNYDAAQKGWYVYGTGKVSADGKQIVPDPGVEIYQFTGAMVGSSSVAKSQGPTASPPPNTPPPKEGDPVDLSSGLFIYGKTDLVLPDVIPIALRRTYTANDSASRSLGVGAMQDYDMFLVGDSTSYTYQELCLPDGSRIHFYRTSSGTGYSNAVYAHTSTNSKWYGATITFNGGAVFAATNWILTTRDGTSYYFPNGIGQTNPAKMALLGITDRHGNVLTIARDSGGNITQITSPNGRYITFQHDSSGRLTQAQDNIGRAVGYTYDSSGHLSTVTDANSGVTTYTYDSNDRMLTIKDARGFIYLTNQYDSNGRVTKQTLADGSTYQFAWTPTSTSALTYAVAYGSGYSSPGGSASIITGFRTCSLCSEGYMPLVSQVDVTDRRGVVREVQFGSTGQMTSDTHAKGTSTQQVFTYTYYSDNLLQSVADPLGRTTAYTYDANGNITQITRLSGTSNAVSTSYTYDSSYSQITSVADPLSHTVSFTIDANGNTTAVTDPLSHQTTLTYNSQGQVIGITDPLNHVTQFQYDAADLNSFTDPLGRTVSRFDDSAGRLLAVQNALGQTTRYGYDSLNEVTSVKNPISGQTSFGYDGNGDLTSVTDANSRTTSYTYNNMDRMASRTDPLTRSESYQYDGNGNLTQFTDRRGKVTTYTYDNLNRRTFAGFNTQTGPTYDSTIIYTYDAGNRLTQAVDSVTGTLSRTYDSLDRMTQETTPQGSVSYGYDGANRRTSMTVGGQTVVSYTYDNANRLTQITRGTPTVSFAYDNASRRSSLTLPNGVVTSYSYDSGSELTGITYTLGTTTLGNLTYAYDLARRRTNVGGSLASVTLPNAITTTAYDAANELTQWGTATPTYDSNGNLLSDGTNSYVWTARNQLASMNLGGASFQYDPLGRRVAKTIIGTTTNYLYDGANPLQELAGTTPTANLLTGMGADEYYTRTDSSGTANFLTDALGSTLALTNGSGSALASYTYEPFGKTTISGTSASTYQYTGRENDGTGVYFYRARYYSPTFQRFIDEDPVGFRGGMNKYAYALANPMDNRDPSGLWTFGGGLTINLQFGPVNIEGSFGLVVDGSGNVGVYGTTGGGLGVGATASVGAGLQWSPNAHGICDLAGPFQYGSVSAGAGLDGTVDEFTGYNSDGTPIVGGGLTVGAGVGGGVSGGLNGTVVIPVNPIPGRSCGCN